MQLDRRASIGISTRVFLGFAAVLLVFGAVLGYGVYSLHEVQRSTRLIHHSYVPLSLTLSEANADLATYEAVLKERDKTVLRRVMQAQKVLYPFARQIRGRLARSNDFVAIGFERASRDPDLEFLKSAETRLAALQEELPGFETESDSFRAAVLGDDWDEATRQQNALRQRVEHLKAEFRDLSKRTRAEISDAIGRNDASEREALTGIAVLAVVALVVALFIMWLVHRTVRPIRDLTRAARTLGQGEHAERVVVTGRDEIGQLADEFNRMADKIETRERTLRERGDELQEAYERVLELRAKEERTKAELIKKERLAAIGRMTSQVTHELRNPLSSLGLNVEMLEEELRNIESADADEARELVRAVLDEVDRLTEITEEYLAYARLPLARPRAIDINELLDALLAFIGEELSIKGIEVERERVSAIAVQADPNQLRRALLNLIRNAVEAMPAGGKLNLSTRVDGDDDAVVVSIEDSGQGIPAADLERIFDPFYSTKELGTGLGLPLTSQIIEEHGGALVARSTEGQGTVFEIRLPGADAPVDRSDVVDSGDEIGALRDAVIQ